MSGLEIFYVLLAIYIAVLILSIAGKFNAWAGEFNLPTSADWVKLIFWPITVVVYLLGLILWLLIWVSRKLFKGICICFYDTKDFFINVFCNAIEKKIIRHKS